MDVPVDSIMASDEQEVPFVNYLVAACGDPGIKIRMAQLSDGSTLFRSVSRESRKKRLP